MSDERYVDRCKAVQDAGRRGFHYCVFDDEHKGEHRCRCGEEWSTCER